MKSSSAVRFPRRASGFRPSDRRERRRVETRERIYRAALRIFAQRGYLETTVEDITDAADVGKGTFFNYFPTKAVSYTHLDVYKRQALRVRAWK